MLRGVSEVLAGVKLVISVLSSYIVQKVLESVFSRKENIFLFRVKGGQNGPKIVIVGIFFWYPAFSEGTCKFMYVCLSVCLSVK